MNKEKEITKILMELGTPCHLAGYDLIRSRCDNVKQRKNKANGYISTVG